MRGYTKALAAVFAGALCWSLAAQATAAPAEASTPWLEKRFGYVARSESLRSLLYDFGTTLGVPVVVSNAVNAIADGEIPVMPAERFLAEIHTRFGLIWVYDGTMLYLYDGAEAASDTVPFPASRRGAFSDAVDAAGVRGVPLGWVVLPAENALQLSGPPRFVEWAAELAGAIATHADGSTGERPDLAVRIFEVEHGYVDRAPVEDAQAPVAGLAEMVAKLMNVGHVSPQGTGGTAASGVAKLRGSGVIPQAPQAIAPGPDADVVTARPAGSEAFVVGDPRLNAIIVRDLPERMPAYERLIAELDRPVDQIEIAVSVLDIDASAADELRFAFAAGGVEIDAGAEGGGSISYEDDADRIALRIRALRNAGKSRILTRPSVTTLDHQEASFVNNRTFYVRLGGNDAEAVDLAPVSYGWVVRLRPHIVYADDHTHVQLAIHIEDGSRGHADLAVTGVPEVSQNVIRTQAVVREGRSLLIGGYTVREQTRFRQRIPVLGRVPVLGRLLSTRADRDQSLARYFLITPTILRAGISYRINTGFDEDPLHPGVGEAPVPDVVEEPPAASPAAVLPQGATP